MASNRRRPQRPGLDRARYARVSPAKVRVLLTRASRGRMDAVQELMESDAVNSLAEWLQDRPHRHQYVHQLCIRASVYWANQTKGAPTRYTPTIAAYAHYLKWMAWTLHPIEKDDL